MNLKHPNKWFAGGAIALIAAAVVGGGVAVASSGGSPASSAHSGSTTHLAKADAATTSGSSYLQSKLVQQFATEGSVGSLKVLVSAGPGSLGSNSSAVVIGTNAAGQTCWTIVGIGGAVGGSFRCGGQIGQESGEPADQQILRVGCATSGSATSTTADSASCIGFVGSTVATVNATLSDGSTQSMTVTDGAFAYAASIANKLPTSFTASDASGHVVGQQDVSLSSSVG